MTIHFSVARLITAPSQHLTDLVRKSLMRPETRSNRAAGSMAEFFTQKLRPKRLTAPAAEERAMNTPFDDHSTPAQEAIVLGRSVHPGYIDLPFVTSEVLRDGRQDFGAPVRVADLSVDDLVALEAVVDDYERDVHAQIAALRRQIDERSYTLDVTGQLTLGFAA